MHWLLNWFYNYNHKITHILLDRPLKQWGADLMTTLPAALDYIKKEGSFVEENIEAS